MLAINLRDKKEYNVLEYLNILYITTEDEFYKYHILEETTLNEIEVDYYNNYSYYKIGNKIYSSFISNVYKSFAKQENIDFPIQLTLF